MIVTVASVVLILCFATFVASSFFLVRNQWVFKQRARLIDAHFNGIFARLKLGERGPFPEWDENLPSYDRMLYRYFWIWDINKLKGRR